jgi:hypothetical protein
MSAITQSGMDWWERPMIGLTRVSLIFLIGLEVEEVRETGVRVRTGV